LGSRELSLHIARWVKRGVFQAGAVVDTAVVTGVVRNRTGSVP
jgi:hypothetical protein